MEVTLWAGRQISKIYNPLGGKEYSEEKDRGVRHREHWMGMGDGSLDEVAQEGEGGI